MSRAQGSNHLASVSLDDILAPWRWQRSETRFSPEDFARFANAVPAYHFRLGIAEKGVGSGGLHTPGFRAHNDAVAVGMRAMASLVLGYLERSR